MSEYEVVLLGIGVWIVSSIVFAIIFVAWLRHGRRGWDRDDD